MTATVLYLIGMTGVIAICGTLLYAGCKMIDSYDAWRESRKTNK